VAVVSHRSQSFVHECRADQQALARHEGRSDGRDLSQDRSGESLHAKGGTRRAKGGNLSIPSSVNVQRTSGGAVRTQQQPKNLRNSFKRGRFIFQRQGRSTRKAKGRIKLMYSLRPSVPIRQRGSAVPCPGLGSD
jgi:hypothetical protein